MPRVVFGHRLVVAFLTALMISGASYIPSSLTIPLITPHHQAFASTVPYMKLPWSVGDKDVLGKPIYFGGGPHGAPSTFPCSAKRLVSAESGLDFDMSWDTDVLAVADGWVVVAQKNVPDSRGPNIVGIDHGDGFMTQYWHLRSIDPAITVGKWIAQGTRVGGSGAPSDAQHLHLEFRSYRDSNLPTYPHDGSSGVPYPAHGVTLDGYTARAEILTDLDTQTGTHLGWNYRGTLTRGTDSPQSIPDRDGCGTTVQEWTGSDDGSGNPATVWSIPWPAAHPGIVTGSTNTVPTVTPSVLVTRAWTADPNNFDPTTNQQTTFQLGQDIRFWAHTSTDPNGPSIPAHFDWQAVGPRQLLSLSGDITVPPGETDWYSVATTTVPTDAWEGNYSFRTLWSANGASAGQASDFTLVPPSGVSTTTPTYYIVLTWDKTLADLDAQLTTPSGTTVYYGNKGNLNSDPWASLDNDDVSAPGMETIGISKPQPGIYSYAVKNYGNTSNLANSLTAVRVYKGTSLIMECQAPAQGSGSWWNVFQLNNGTLSSGCGALSDHSASSHPVQERGKKHKLPPPQQKHPPITALHRLQSKHHASTGRTSLVDEALLGMPIVLRRQKQ